MVGHQQVDEVGWTEGVPVVLIQVLDAVPTTSSGGVSQYVRSLFASTTAV